LLSVDHLNGLRLAEIEKIAPHLSPASRILEIGAGTGEQAADLSRRGFDVSAIEIADSAYSAQRVYPITDYNGKSAKSGHSANHSITSSARDALGHWSLE
jgi:protein-L-isoaspartate O-methyltransferase